MWPVWLRGYSRREFLAYCGKLAALLGLSPLSLPKIGQALEEVIKKPSVVWLNFSACTGCTESFIKSECPSVSEIVLKVISLDFNETVMAAAGKKAENILDSLYKQGQYYCLIEGAIPLKHGYGRIGGREMMEIAQRVTARATRVIAIGTCASFGGTPGARPNPSEAKGVADALGIDVINLPGCPVNPDWIMATLLNVFMFGKCPELDSLGRPRIIYGLKIHDNCERRAHFDAGRFLKVFGTEAAGKNYCLYKLGCKGSATYSNCPLVKWNGGTNWCIQSRSPCIGCVEPSFWDSFAPLYERLPEVRVPAGKGVEATADRIGTALAVATAAGIGAHMVGTYLREKKIKGKKIEVNKEE